MSNDSTASARRQQHEREIDAAMDAGRIACHATVRASWVAAFENDEAAARRDLTARPTGQFSATNAAAARAAGPSQARSLDRALRTVAGNSAGASFGQLPEERR